MNPQPAATQKSGAEHDTAQLLLDATVECLKQYGYAGLSTRKVAEQAGVPLSQIHYHFGSKKKMVVALFERQNERLLERQTAMYDEPLPLWRRWEKACDFLDDDLESGYVRIFMELTAAGWSDPEIAEKVKLNLGKWEELVARVAREASDTLGGFGPFDTREVGTLIAMLFMGAEVNLLGRGERDHLPIKSALRKIGELIRLAEEKTGQ